jgi:DNA-binding SARP family transcriptional activator
LSDSLAVPRLKVEALWGLSRAHGFRGALEAAREAAEEGLGLAHRAGDEWIAALIRVSLGAGYALAGRTEEASEWLGRAWTAFHECGDTYGQAVARLWQCLVWSKVGDTARLERGLDDLLDLVQAQRYDYLFSRQTLLGPLHPPSLVPLLLYARDHGIRRAYAERLLSQLELVDLELHPGYRLSVRTLGAFRVWRGREEISPTEWRREKARQLFLLFLTYRHRMLDREQIVELLWPGLDAETALRDFKVALSTLFKVLEPERGRGAPSAFVARDGTLYGLRPEADLWLDADEFEALVREADALFEGEADAALDRYRRALALYKGEYLQEYPYEDWTIEERERLLTLYLRTAERLATALLERGEWKEAITVADSILARDDCWEQAYRTMMRAYARLGNRAQVHRVYRRCVESLREELAVEPSPLTTELYEALLESDAPVRR